MQGQTKDFISVIIPVYNDPQGLKDTLESVSVQEYPAGCFEIIVADNGSNDDTINIATDFCKRFPGLIKVVIEDRVRSSYAARNKGIEASKGTVIAFIDADMTVEKDWLKKIVFSLHKSKALFLSCRVEIVLNKNTIFSLYNSITGFNNEKSIVHNHFSPTCSLVVKKVLFERVGLFDPRLISGGDYEFGNRVYKAGYPLIYEPDILMEHPARASCRTFYKKFFRIGRGHFQLSVFYPKIQVYVTNSFRISNYLPPKPVEFFKYFKDGRISKNNFGFLYMLIFYFIKWSVKIVIRSGFIYQGFKQKGKK
jgi:glycosyltransferase AglI